MAHRLARVLSDGGELVECNACPKVYHTDCLDMKRVPKGAWYCPWHSCVECARKISSAGGMLFRCSDCPTAYCFDCWPAGLERISPDEKWLSALLRRGYDPTNRASIFVCGNCADEKETARRRAEEAEREREARRQAEEIRRREVRERLARQAEEASEKQRQRELKVRI